LCPRRTVGGVRGRRDEQVHRITDAPDPHTADLNARMTRYLISMAIRTACVVLAFVTPSPWRWVFVVGAIGLPYVAVILANTKGTPKSGLPVFDPGTDRASLPQGRSAEGSPPPPNG
jgi:hypothetical protein